MTEPEEPFAIPIQRTSWGGVKWVALAATAVVAVLGTIIFVLKLQDDRAAEAQAERQRLEEEQLEREREARRKRAPSGIPLASAHKPPPGWKPPAHRIPSKELFDRPGTPAGGLLPTPLPGGMFGIALPPTWETQPAGDLLVMRAPENHFVIVAALGTHADDGNTKKAIEKIGAVSCNWRRGDGPKHGRLGTQRIPAFFNEGACAHTDGYGLIWIVRLFAGERVTSLVARYSSKAGEDAEEVLLEILRSIVPIDG
jgi:hypothetical protein